MTADDFLEHLYAKLRFYEKAAASGRFVPGGGWYGPREVLEVLKDISIHPPLARVHSLIVSRFLIHDGRLLVPATATRPPVP